MKNIATMVLVVLIVSSTLISCKKHDFAKGVLSPITYLSEIRAIYRGADVSLTNDNLNGANQVNVLVISDPEGGNIPAGILVVQNTDRNGTNGIVLTLANSGDFKLGDSLQLKVVGSTLKKVEGSMQLTGLTADKITVLSSGNPTKPTSVTSYNLNLNPNAYESTLIKINAANINPAPKPTDTLAGEINAVNGADSIIVHTEKSAGYAGLSVPSSASFAGILFLSKQNGGAAKLKLWPRNEGDITDIVDPIDPNAPNLGNGTVLISGLVSDAKGADGNYEYFQLIATKDVDFSKTPMALVTCTNAGSAVPYKGAAPAGGWATGGGRTYKFNVTEGKVKKGELFYIGGSFKRINGANSTLIDNANWVRSITYNADAGDGFGDKTGGLLPNSGNAGGVAIFDGITVAETTIPVDVVFYGGTGITTIFDETNNFGYRVANNDHYKNVNPTTAAAQPFFYQGTNNYVIPHQNPADQGIFTKLGGVFDVKAKKWITPRGYVFYPMSQTSALTEIETGDVTKIVN